MVSQTVGEYYICSFERSYDFTLFIDVNSLRADKTPCDITPFDTFDDARTELDSLTMKLIRGLAKEKEAIFRHIDLQIVSKNNDKFHIEFDQSFYDFVRAGMIRKLKEM